MADYYAPNQLRASSSAFQWGRLVFTDYKTGCLRKILIQSRAVQADIKEQYKLVGALNEKRHEERLSKLSKRYIREYEFETPIVLQSDAAMTLSGHVDFVHLNDDGVPASLDELKSVTSINVYRKVIKGGSYVTENLAQTVNYMINVKVPSARLIYTYYIKTGDKGDESDWTYTSERIFNVAIDDFGRINVDDKPTRFTVGDQLAHRHAAATAIATGAIAERPNLWDAPFQSPCHFCPFKDACDQWDRNEIESSDAFVNYAKSLLSKE